MFKWGFCLIVVCATALTAESAIAEDAYYGKFLDDLKGQWHTQTKPRPTFELEKDFRFQDPNGLIWTAPAKIKVDGASIPQSLWSLVGGPFEGAYISASVIHDHYCRTKERTTHDTHRNFYYGMRAAGVPEWEATLKHWAVATFGPSWTLRKQVIATNICAPALGNMVCTSVPQTVTSMVSEPAVDLSDPANFAVAVAKTQAIARTLKTSNGRILDVTPSGQVDGQLASVEASAKFYRRLFASNENITAPAKLGILASTNNSDDLTIQPWASGTVPKLSEVRVLEQRSKNQIADNAPFKLNRENVQLIQDRVQLDSLKSSVELLEKH